MLLHWHLEKRGKKSVFGAVLQNKTVTLTPVIPVQPHRSRVQQDGVAVWSHLTDVLLV